MLPESFIKEVSSIKGAHQNQEVHVRFVEHNEYTDTVHSTLARVTNVVEGIQGIELVCEPL